LQSEKRSGARITKTTRNGSASFGSFCKDAEISDDTARNWQSVYTEYTDGEFEEKIAELRELKAKS
jgi:hypothetical protein